MNYKSFTALLLIAILSACESESIPAPDLKPDYEYAGVKLGRIWEYQYDTLNYLSNGSNKQSSKGFLQIKVEEDIGNGVFSISKSYKKTLSAKYVTTRIEKITLKDKTIQTSDNNLTFINLVLPPEKNTVWQGNRLFNADQEFTVNSEKFKIYNNWEYKITSVDTTLNILGKTYANSLVVTAKPELENLLSKRLSQEAYSKDVGLIRKYQMILNTQRIEPATAWEVKGQAGYIYTLELISFK